MPKLTVDFSVPVNVLIRDDGTKEMLLAIAFFRGEGGAFAGPVRDALTAYCYDFQANLPEKDRKRFGEILESVKVTEAYRKANKADTPRRRR